MSTYTHTRTSKLSTAAEVELILALVDAGDIIYEEPVYLYPVEPPPPRSEPHRHKSKCKKHRREARGW